MGSRSVTIPLGLPGHQRLASRGWCVEGRNRLYFVALLFRKVAHNLLCRNFTVSESGPSPGAELTWGPIFSQLLLC